MTLLYNLFGSGSNNNSSFSSLVKMNHHHPVGVRKVFSFLLASLAAPQSSCKQHKQQYTTLLQEATTTTTTITSPSPEVSAAPSGREGRSHTSKRSSRSSRSSRRDNNNNNNNDDTTTTTEETLVELFVQLTVSIGLAVVCGLLAQYIMRNINAVLESSSSSDNNDNGHPPKNQITARLQAILQKRANAAAAAAAADDDDDDEEQQQQQQADKTNKNNNNNSNRNNNHKDKQTTKKTTIQKKKKHVVPRVTCPPLTTYELQMAANILDPDDIEASFANVGGLDKTKEELYALAILPLLQPQLFQGSALVQPCKGILLYGPPGTGKTLLAKALAKEAAAVFLPLPLSTILNKWVGESNKLVAATFSLATKLAPAIIFIDELDTFLKANSHETAYLDTIKSEFLTWWDGITTQSSAQVLVLGATNRPQHIDAAILRRMPRAFLVPLPESDGRLAILQLLLKDEHTSEQVQPFLPQLAQQTKGYSGSDLKELCKTAAMIRIQERTHEFSQARTRGQPVGRTGTSNSSSSSSYFLTSAARQTPLRALSVHDLQVAQQKVRPTGQAAQEFGHTAARQAFAQRPSSVAAEQQQQQLSLQDLAMLLRQFSDLSMRDENPLRQQRNNGTSRQGNDSDNADDREEGEEEIPELN